MLKIDFQDENFKTFLSETTRPRALIFGMKHHLVDLYQNCSNNATGRPEGHLFNIGLYRVGWFCCFTSQVNSYGHCGTVSSPNHFFLGRLEQAVNQ